MPNQPIAPRLPPMPIPNNNLNSVVDSLRVMRQHLLSVGGQTPASHQQYINPTSVVPVTGQPNRQHRWSELQRKVEPTALVNPNDSSQFIVFPRTSELILHDAMTREQWIYRHKAHPKGPTGIRRKNKPKPPPTGMTAPTGPTGPTGPTAHIGVLVSYSIFWTDDFLGTSCGGHGPDPSACGVEVNAVRMLFSGGVWNISGTIKGVFTGCAPGVGGSLSSLAFEHSSKLEGDKLTFGWVDSSDIYIPGLGPFTVADIHNMTFSPSNPILGSNWSTFTPYQESLVQAGPTLNYNSSFIITP